MDSLPPLSVHRLNRLLLWTRVWLTMAQRIIPQRGRLAAHLEMLLAQRVASIRAMCVTLLFLHAMERVDTSAISTRVNRPAGAWRKAIGSHLRRLLYRRTIAAQIEALLEVLRDPEAVIARLKRGMRPASLVTLVRETLLGGACVITPATISDTS